MATPTRRIYIIVEATSADELIQRVGIKIADDYVPQGGLAVFMDKYTITPSQGVDMYTEIQQKHLYQAMIDKTFFMTLNTSKA